MKTITPCLWFDHEAEDAAKFYTSIFKNSKIKNITHYTEEGQEIHGQKPGTVLTVEFQIMGLPVTALNGGPIFKINPSISLSVTFETIEETERVWKELIKEGKALIPLDKQEWSERYGWVQDKFGMSWQISVLYNQDDKEGVMPSLLFTDKLFGRAEEAVKFYISFFKNSSIQAIKYYPPEDTNAGKLLYSEFILDGSLLSAMDGPGEHKFKFSEGVSLQVFCDTQDEIDYFWKNFTTDGEEGQCGWLKDKFGVSWQIVPTILPKLLNDPAKAERVTKAFLKMKKFDIEKLEHA